MELIRITAGKYFKIVDSDDWVDKKGLELLVDYLSKNDIDLVMNPFHMISFSDKRKLKLIDSRPLIPLIFLFALVNIINNRFAYFLFWFSKCYSQFHIQ